MGVQGILWYNLRMFVRKKKNSSGSISIQIISKKNGKYKLVETIGCSKDKFEIEELVKKLVVSFYDGNKGNLWPDVIRQTLWVHFILKVKVKMI